MTGKLKPDAHNANRGTDRGRAMLRRSLQELGAGRSVLADKHGAMIAGNKTLGEAEALGIPTRVVETDGSELIVVQRNDLDLDKDEAARRLAYSDNRVSEVSLDWDANVIASDLDDGLPLDDLFDEAELDDLFEAAAASVAEDVEGSSTHQAERDGPEPTFRPVLPMTAISRIEQALTATGETSRGRALLILCEAFLKDDNDPFG